MKYHITTIGCQMNKADAERIAFYLEGLGLAPAAERRKADLAVLVTCGVRQSAEDRIYGLAPKIKKENKKVKIVLTGCLALRPDVQKRLKGKVDIWMPITELPRLAGKLGLGKAGGRTKDYLSVKAKYQSDASAFVPIGNGCDNFCSYCVVPYARGRETYRPAAEILKEIGALVKKEYKEIILIAQNVNSYRDKKIDFADLLKAANDIPGDFWIRFATSHPKDMSDKLIRTAAAGEKICKHIHLPAQSGDNKILKAMNRKYTIEHYKNLIKKIRQIIPNAVITTDIIVGFPGETRRQFNNTKRLFREVKYDMAYIARFSPRFGTAAAKMADNVAPKEKKRREKELMEILRKTVLKNNQAYLGKTVKILAAGVNKKGEFYGETGTGKNARIKTAGAGDLIGKFLNVKITGVGDFGLEGERIKKSPDMHPGLGC